MIQGYAVYEKRIPIGYGKMDHVKIDGIKQFYHGCEKNFLTLSGSTSTGPSNPVEFQIHSLLSLKLSKPIGIIIEPDDGGFIARSLGLPLYGFGDDVYEAIEMLKLEIETLYFDLNEDDDVTDNWVPIKAFLNGIIE
jgi:hypothetical protein